ncbi:MAG: sugar phosphate isomerase/epimerase [Fimbriimonadales bacterium]|nr:sugar phosphate isomerase/epimerase [Fimbriimonadales bacterium]
MPNIGLQLYTLRDDLKADFEGTVRAVGQMGYEYIETTGFMGEHSPTMKQLLAETGLKIAGLGFDLRTLETEPQQVIDACREWNAHYAVTFWIDEAQRQSADDWKRIAERFNRIGESLAQGNVPFYYHLHGYEFTEYDGKRAIDILLDNTDSRYFNLEPDTYWVEYGGVDARAFCEQYAPRIRALHLKDYLSKPDMHDIEVGEGAIDMRGILKLALQYHWQWLIIEQERYLRPPIESAARCLQNVKQMLQNLQQEV